MRLFLVGAFIASVACTHTPSAAPPPTAPPAAQPPTDEAAAFAKARAGFQALMRQQDPAAALPLFEEAWALGLHDGEVAYGAARAAAALKKPDDAVLWLTRADELWPDFSAELVTDPPVFGEVKDLPAVAALLQRARARAEAKLAESRPGSGLVRSSPEAEGIDPQALAALVEAARASRSSGLVLLRNGKLVGEWYFDQTRAPLEAMSATKSVTSLAVGLLIDDGKIASIDEPVSTFFPEWKEGEKAKVTIRHLLSHTSGLEAGRTTEKIYASPDFVRHALDSEVKAPGTVFFYNNSATNLLAGLVGVAAGKRMDEYLRERLFAPLGITDTSWTLDQAGNPHGMSGLQIHPADFAKVGQLMLQGGVWDGRRVISEAWVTASTAPSQPFNPTCGLLWWLLSPGSYYSFEEPFFREMEARKVKPELVAKLAPVRGKRLTRTQLLEELRPLLGDRGFAEFQMELARVGLTLKQEIEGGYDGFAALGYLGQQLLVFPGEQLVAVRMARPSEAVPSEVLEFSEFPKRARALVPEATKPGR